MCLYNTINTYTDHFKLKKKRDSDESLLTAIVSKI